MKKLTKKGILVSTIYNDNRLAFSPPSIAIREFEYHQSQTESREPTTPHILDIGCNKGYLGKRIKENSSATITGIDIDKDDLKTARINYDRVGLVDLNDMEKAKDFLSNQKFDYIFLLDILEHLLTPEALLNLIQNYTESHTKLFISLPNVANFSVRLPLLFGRFQYRNHGILDKTHVHLYTAATGKQLLESCGYRIEKIQFSSNRFGRWIEHLPFLGTFLGYTVIYTVTPPLDNP